jgi:NAD+ synthase (glutamine-hydrolysing)
MPQLRIALAQIDTVVGDLDGNAALVLSWSLRAQEAGAHLVAFPEMTLTGYPPEDLVLRPSFVHACQQRLKLLAEELATAGTGELVVGVGHVGEGPSNCFSLLHRGMVMATAVKHHLPNYGVFDEARYFRPSDALTVVRVHGVDVALTICEDLWQDGGPLDAAAAAGVGLVLCTNGSPFEQAKDDFREALATRRAREAGAPLAYVNLVGGQDELVFDGGSFVTSAQGEVLARSPRFVTDLALVDLDLAAGHHLPQEAVGLRIEHTVLTAAAVAAYPPCPPLLTAALDHDEEVWQALVTGLRSYVEKNGFASVALGLSGGIDSAVVATLAVDALGAGRVHTVALPSAYSSPGSLDDAADLARLQGTQHRVLPIAPMVDAYQAVLHLSGLAEENLQARVRGTTLMALSNAEGHLILTTGNKSELATGFSTLYGDSAGGFAPLKDVPKTLVWQLARWRNTRSTVIPTASIDKPPSAELAPGQLDSDRLPDYDELDAILDGYVEGDQGREELVGAGHDPAVVDRIVRLVDLAEYKRRQSAPGPKITTKAFGRDRRLPITNRWRQT